MSTFDPDAFINSAVTAANDTFVVPVPVAEYQAIIEEVKPRQWQSQDGTKTGIAVDLTWVIQDPAVAAKLGREKVTVKQGIMLDTLPSGALDMSAGRNVQLGRLREAIGKNIEGQPFTFSMLPGLAAKVAVTHRDGKNPGEVYAEIRSVSKL